MLQGFLAPVAGREQVQDLVVRGMRMEDSEGLDAAALRQQRRLKQAIRFLHRDSADLLPLDGLKKLGTSKQGQPHNILQKRLLEAKLSRNRMNMCGSTANPHEGLLLSCNLSTKEDVDEEEQDLIHVASKPFVATVLRCVAAIKLKCFGQEVKVLINTGCKLNLMSLLTVERLGLKELVEENKLEADAFPYQPNLCIYGQITELSLTIGQLRIMTSFLIVEINQPLVSLGTKTLKSLKCVIDTDKEMLVFGTTMREQVQFAKKPFSDSSSNFGQQDY